MQFSPSGPNFARPYLFSVLPSYYFLLDSIALILPWVQVPHLASHLFGLVVRRLPADWFSVYRHPVHLLETFVDRSRFRGTCYQAANWVRVGSTTGRTRQDRHHRLQTPVKDHYLYPLCRDFRQRLCT